MKENRNLGFVHRFLTLRNQLEELFMLFVHYISTEIKYDDQNTPKLTEIVKIDDVFVLTVQILV